MSDLIDRETLKETMLHEVLKVDSEKKWDGGCWIRYKMFERVLASIPSAQSERKRGRWIESKDIIVRGTCSCCGWDAITDETDVVGMPFCPNCGARMGGEPKKGKWQWTDDTYTCSECAYHAYGKAWEILNGVLQICPNCGAKMERK